MESFVQSVLAQVADGSVLSLLALALATLISEDLACIAAGLLVAQGSLTFGPATLACFTGILAGDYGLVILGRVAGRRSLELAPLKWWVTPAAVLRAEQWFAQRGPRLILVSRFMPGTRLPTYVAAGLLRAPLLEFAGWFVLACALWTPLLVGVSALVGHRVLQWYAEWTRLVPALILAGVLAWAATWILVRLSTWRSRRLLLMRWRRLTRWEFWPMWAVYPPVIAQILWLGLKHRSLTLFTATNPGIGAGGGFVGEFKSEILRGLSAAGETVANWRLIAPGAVEDRCVAVQDFMKNAGLTFPVVLKPDVGERGRGVAIVASENQLRDVLREQSDALIAQAYVPGVEFGVFYVRRPSAARGEVWAITEKLAVSVVGDGEQTLEELILGDARAVCMAEFFLDQFSSRLGDVVANGERVALSELGTHCRGALFLDGAHRLTPALEDAIERASAGFTGFFLGRYDVRAESVEAFCAGDFRIIELNGVTSEPTSIYDPRHSVWFGWSMLCRQWRLAFEIAAENRKRGLRPLTVSQTWRLVFPTSSST
jgi:membrane protein DedA with SNARE-associated domain